MKRFILFPLMIICSMAIAGDEDSQINWSDATITAPSDDNFTFDEVKATGFMIKGHGATPVMYIGSDGTFKFNGEEVKGASEIYEKFVQVINGVCKCEDEEARKRIGEA